jgi:hypothetical protein
MKKSTADAIARKPQKFHITLTLTTGGQEKYTEAKVRRWVEKVVKGSELGSVNIGDVIDTTK